MFYIFKFKVSLQRTYPQKVKKILSEENFNSIRLGIAKKNQKVKQLMNSLLQFFYIISHKKPVCL